MKLQKIIQVIESHTDEKLDVKNRKRHIVSLRFIYFKLARELTNYSLQRIGKALNKDHATVLHGLNMFEVISKEKNYQLLYDKCKRQLLNSPVISEFGINEIVNFYETILSELQLKYDSVKNHEKQELYDAIVSMDESTFKEFDETRLKPFLKMHKVA